MYSSLQSNPLHLHLYVTSLFCVMLSLSLGDTRRILILLLPPEVDLNAYPTTNALNTSVETLGIRYHHVDLTVVFFLAVGVVGIGVVVPGTNVGMCVSVLVVDFSLKSVEGPYGVLVPE